MRPSVLAYFSVCCRWPPVSASLPHFLGPVLKSHWAPSGFGLLLLVGPRLGGLLVPQEHRSGHPVSSLAERQARKSFLARVGPARCRCSLLDPVQDFAISLACARCLFPVVGSSVTSPARSHSRLVFSRRFCRAWCALAGQIWAPSHEPARRPICALTAAVGPFVIPSLGQSLAWVPSPPRASMLATFSGIPGCHSVYLAARNSMCQEHCLQPRLQVVLCSWFYGSMCFSHFCLLWTRKEHAIK
jgi:hypothetical protein